MRASGLTPALAAEIFVSLCVSIRVAKLVDIISTSSAYRVRRCRVRFESLKHRATILKYTSVKEATLVRLATTVCFDLVTNERSTMACKTLFNFSGDDFGGVSTRRRPEYDAAEAFQSYRSRSSRGEFRARDRPSLVDDDERG